MSPAPMETLPPPPKTAAARILYREVLDTIDPDFDRALTLYASVFPAAERMSREEFVVALEAKRAGRMSPDNFRFLVSKRAGQILGMCCGRFIEHLQIGFVSYLAVDPNVQRQRIGSALRRHLVHGFRRDAQLAGHDDLEAVVGEVEADNTWISILVGRRKVLALDIPYAQPPLRPGMPEVPLVFYYQPVAPPELPEALPTTKVEDILRGIFRDVYRMEDPDADPTFRRILEGFAGRTHIGPRDLRVARRVLHLSRRAAVLHRPHAGAGGTMPGPAQARPLFESDS